MQRATHPLSHPSVNDISERKSLLCTEGQRRSECCTLARGWLSPSRLAKLALLVIGFLAASCGRRIDPRERQGVGQPASDASTSSENRAIAVNPNTPSDTRSPASKHDASLV